jgi:hypothetical protein
MHTWKKIGVHHFLKNGFGVKGLALMDKRGTPISKKRRDLYIELFDLVYAVL